MKLPTAGVCHLSTSWRLAWPDQVSLSADDGRLGIAGPRSRLALREPRSEILAALRRLSPPGEHEERLADAVLTAGGAESLARWFYCINQLNERGLIRRSLWVGEKPLATIAPQGEPLATDRKRHSNRPGAAYVLSRFTYLHRDGSEMVIESPLAHARIILHDPLAAAVVVALAAPATIEELGRYACEMPVDAVAALVDALAENCLVDQLSDEPSDNVASVLETWEFHDLLFHSRSRRGRYDAPFGGTYRLAHRPPPPAVKDATCGPGVPAASAIQLDRPDIERLMRDDPPLAYVQERRKSLRSYGETPMKLAQLGEFLFRVARVKDRYSADVPTPSGTVTFDLTSRPYPAGGGLYEMEFYLAIRRCEGLSPGLYHYEGVAHALTQVAASPRHVEALVDEAAASAGIEPKTVQTLVILAARFERLAWKYESIAYALALKHVGVLYQTMYLAATAMGLAPCALGCGDSDLFARASNLDYYSEASVGEFLLGSVATPASLPGR
ncbi:MAG TPA: SagB family peptide dehydrogenase [Pirellulales bacterium]|nr:SagB family peptide dehydrogenase [Pirellulales bacterium]